MLSLSETLQIQSMSGMSPSPVGPSPFCWIQEGTHNYLLPASVLGLSPPSPFIVIDIESSRPSNKPFSSDLWVTGDVPGATDSGKSVELEYAVGTASGARRLDYSRDFMIDH